MKRRSLVVLNLFFLFTAAASLASEMENDSVDFLAEEEELGMETAAVIPPPIIRPVCRFAPDLIVSALPEPTWDETTRRSVIRVVIRNQGGVGTGAGFQVRLVADGVPYNQFTGPLAARATRVLVFTLPYWIYNPDAQYTTIVDSLNAIRECREANNSRDFFGLG